MKSSADGATSNIKLELIDRCLWAPIRDAVATIENQVYEPARRDTIGSLEAVVLHPRGVSVVALEGESVAGFCLGAPLECFSRVSGVRTDPNWGQGNTLYSFDTAVEKRYRGRGIARGLKSFQLDTAKAAGYACVAGRNRVGHADAMWKLNSDLGAMQVQYLEDDYPDECIPNACIYYHIRLR